MSQNKPRKSNTYNIHTSQEVEAIGQAAADGRHARHYSNEDHYANDETKGARVHRVPGGNHSVRLAVMDGENGFEAIEQLTGEQDADSHLAILYIANLLAPPLLQPVGAEDSWVSFDDVIDKIGWDPRSTEERREMHRRVFNILRFGARAKVIGQRGGYEMPGSKKKIDTQIESSLWQIHEVERPQQLALTEETPVKAQVLLTPRWATFLASPQMAQYLPLGEALGAIKGNKPSGAWARVIGLALASFWRRLPRESLDGSIRPTRRELLERYPPKTGSVADVLASNNPGFALQYWHGALQILVASGFIEPSGEALITLQQARASMPRQAWAQQWLNGRVDIQPKALMKDAIKSRGKALPDPSVPPKKRQKKGAG